MADNKIGIGNQPKITVNRQGAQDKQPYVEKYIGDKYPEAKGRAVKREGERRYIEVLIKTTHPKSFGLVEIDPIETEAIKKIYLDAKEYQLEKVEQEKPKKQSSSRGNAIKGVKALKTKTMPPKGAVGVYRLNPQEYVYQDKGGFYIYEYKEATLFGTEKVWVPIQRYIDENLADKFKK